MSSQRAENDHSAQAGLTQYDRLVEVMAEIRERGRRVLADAHVARAASTELRTTLGYNRDRAPGS